MNDASLLYTEVKFDVLTRVVLHNSFKRVTSPTACSDTLFFPNGCPANGIYPGSGPGTGAPTNFYVNVMGRPAIYKKRYAQLSSSQASTVSSVFPIVTLVVQVDGGKVTKVYWDDNCYFNEGKAAATTSFNMLNCRPNAYDLLSNNQSSPQALNPSGTAPPFTGYDCSLTAPACRTGLANQALPGGFCDLGIYIVWTGTSADGQQLTSAGQRFKRFRTYAMNNQYLTMLNFSGHALPEEPAT